MNVEQENVMLSDNTQVNRSELERLIEKLVKFALCACAKTDGKFAQYLSALWNTGNIDRFMQEMDKYAEELESVR